MGKRIYMFLLLIFTAASVYSQNTTIDKLTFTTDLNSVWEFNTNTIENGLGGGFIYTDKLAQKYQSFGITTKDYKISLVCHLKAGYFLLNDESYKNYTKGTEPKPNKEIVNKLLGEGVSVELCGVTMQNNGWTEKDLLPGVTILAMGAYSRIIDLEKQGYKYIRY